MVLPLNACISCPAPFCTGQVLAIDIDRAACVALLQLHSNGREGISGSVFRSLEVMLHCQRAGVSRGRDLLAPHLGASEGHRQLCPLWEGAASQARKGNLQASTGDGEC